MKRYSIMMVVLIVFILSQIIACWVAGPLPSAQNFDDLVIDFYSVNGDYSLPADKMSELEFELRAMDRRGNPWPGVQVYFSSTLGTITPSSAMTDSNGIARTTLRAGCSPGEALVQAYVIGRLAALSVTFYGDPPKITVEISESSSVSAGTYAPVLIKASLTCSGVQINDFTLDFYSESGCFNEGCNPRLSTTTGVIETTWIPSFKLAEDYTNTPLSNILKVTLVENDLPTDYMDFTELYLYPVNIRIFQDGSNYDENTFCFSVFVYWFDSDGLYPLPGIPVSFSLRNSVGTEAWFSKTLKNTGECCVHWEGEQGEIMITASIDYTGPGDCCDDRPDDIHWTGQILITYDHECAVFDIVQ